jgi:hypothetical protein
MTLIAPAILAAFNMFKRPLGGYIQNNISWPIMGTVRRPREDELVGDVFQDIFIVTLSVPDMVITGIYPPLRYDEIICNGKTRKIIPPIATDYDGETPVFVRLKVEG